MTTAQQHLSEQQVDTAFHVGGLLLRGIGYAVIASIADHYDFGQAMCLGLLVGDIAASVGALLWHRHEGLVPRLAELGLLLLISWCLGQRFDWPADPALRAILGLSAFGVFVSRTGGTMLTRLGPSQDGFS